MRERHIRIVMRVQEGKNRNNQHKRRRYSLNKYADVEQHKKSENKMNKKRGMISK